MDDWKDLLIVLTFVVTLANYISLKFPNRRKVSGPYREEEETIKVKRTKPSLRNPMRPYNTQYDDFKTKRGLYEPVKPRGQTREQEDELEV